MRPSMKMPILLITIVFASAGFDVAALDASPRTPKLISPTDGTLCLTGPVDLDWEDINGARCYQVQISAGCGEGTTNPILDSEKRIYDLDPDIEYFWRVRARFEEWGPWSECWSFGPAQHDLPGTSFPTFPPDGAADVPTEVTFEWDCAVGAVSYELRVGPSCGSGLSYFSTTCAKTVSDLEPGRQYWWMVKGRNVCDSPGSWSNCRTFMTAGEAVNGNGKWSLHFAGPHNSKLSSGDFEILDCADIVVDAPSYPGRYDVYIVAVDVDRIAGTRYGLDCDAPVLFYGWAKNSDLEIPTTGWPGCGEGNAQVWSEERSGPYVTLGVLDIYVYGSPNSLRAVGDPRVDYGEWCDGTMPRPICLKRTKPDAFGAVGFGIAGYNPCFVTPVRLSGFSANATEGGILLEWTSAGSEEFSHFFVHRCIADRNGDYLMLSVDPILGDAGGEWSYSYLDADVTPGTLYYYKLEGIEDGGGGVFFGPYGAVARDVNTECRLSQNVPNPFSRGSATTIHYSVRRAGGVSIRILDAAGRLVATISAAAVPGDNWSTWDGRDTSGRRVSSGVYFYKIEAEGLSAERKMLVVD